MDGRIRLVVLLTGSILLAAGLGVRRYLHDPPLPPQSPVAFETVQEKVENVQEAFASTATVEDSEVEGFVQRLQAAAAAGQGNAILEALDVSRTLDAVEAATGKTTNASRRRALESQLGPQLVSLFDPTVVETTIKRIDRDDRGNVVVYLRMVDRNRVQLKARWWLVPTPNGLRWWDSEDLQLGMRISTVMAASVAMVDAQGADRERFERFLAIMQGVGTEDLNDPAVAQRIATDLDGIELDALPPRFRAFGRLIRAFAGLALGDDEGTIGHLDALEAEHLQPLDYPFRYYLRAAASMELRRYDDVVTSAQRFLDLLGGDAEMYGLLGLAELARGNPEAALVAFDRGIADDPWQTSLYADVALATDDVDAVAQRLQRLPADAVLDDAGTWHPVESTGLPPEQVAEGRARLAEALARRQALSQSPPP